MIEHTQRPWTVARGSHAYPLKILSESRTIAQVKRAGTTQETEANANVLAASTELLAACEDARLFVIRHLEVGKIDGMLVADPRDVETLIKLNSALAKATGR